MSPQRSSAADCPTWCIATRLGWTELMHYYKRGLYSSALAMKQEIVWVRILNGRCMSLYKLGCITSINSSQNIRFNWIPHSVKDVCLVIKTNALESPNNSKTPFQSARMINIIWSLHTHTHLEASSPEPNTDSLVPLQTIHQEKKLQSYHYERAYGTRD